MQTSSLSRRRANLGGSRSYLSARAGFGGKALQNLNMKSMSHALKLKDHAQETGKKTAPTTYRTNPKRLQGKMEGSSHHKIFVCLDDIHFCCGCLYESNHHNTAANRRHNKMMLLSGTI